MVYFIKKTQECMDPIIPSELDDAADIASTAETLKKDLVQKFGIMQNIVKKVWVSALREGGGKASVLCSGVVELCSIL